MFHCEKENKQNITKMKNSTAMNLRERQYFCTVHLTLCYTFYAR